MKTQELLLAALKGKFGDSQTAIAEATGMSLARINNYWHGKRQMDDEAVITCCELLEWNPKKYVAAHRAETATSATERNFWQKLATGVLGIVLMVAGTLLPVSTAEAHQRAHMPVISQNQGDSVYYVI